MPKNLIVSLLLAVATPCAPAFAQSTQAATASLDDIFTAQDAAFERRMASWCM
jgi:hypothetical protein